MNTRKVAISIPKNLINAIDALSKEKGVSRSKFITDILREKLGDERKRRIREEYDRVFSDEAIVREQLETAGWLESGGNPEGQEW